MPALIRSFWLTTLDVHYGTSAKAGLPRITGTVSYEILVAHRAERLAIHQREGAFRVVNPTAVERHSACAAFGALFQHQGQSRRRGAGRFKGNPAQTHFL
jgi:hypothetical protein